MRRVTSSASREPKRNELEYPLYPTEQANAEEAVEALKTSVEIIEAVAKLLPNLGLF